MAGDPAPPSEAAPAPNAIQFETTSGGYTLCYAGEPLAEIDLDSRRVRFLPELNRERQRHVLRLLAPYVLLHEGALVLHASAICLDSSVTAFCAQTGAGKSTLARTFADAGAEWFSEDLLIVRDGAAVRWAEQDLHEFFAKALSEPGNALSLAGLAQSLCGEPAPLRRVAFLTPRQPGAFSINPCAAPQAFEHLIANSFAELPVPSLWRYLFRANAQLAEQVEAATLSVPEGLDPLRAACEAELRERSWL